MKIKFKTKQNWNANEVASFSRDAIVVSVNTQLSKLQKIIDKEVFPPEQKKKIIDITNQLKIKKEDVKIEYSYDI